ncbi:uncharacterized protein LOC5501396 [Nematostella vectensis]|uniref:uncharacterized protein LOC5501396 n=1 Tax=Nematostella vectensis TaxID=45351 RepID=UPI0020777154|nr:uncharacterized protein LOC5501396 [Nematostella vectensis]
MVVAGGSTVQNKKVMPSLVVSFSQQHTSVIPNGSSLNKLTLPESLSLQPKSQPQIDILTIAKRLSNTMALEKPPTFTTSPISSMQTIEPKRSQNNHPETSHEKGENTSSVTLSASSFPDSVYLKSLPEKADSIVSDPKFFSAVGKLKDMLENEKSGTSFEQVQSIMGDLRGLMGTGVSSSISGSSPYSSLPTTVTRTRDDEARGMVAHLKRISDQLDHLSSMLENQQQKTDTNGNTQRSHIEVPSDQVAIISRQIKLLRLFNDKLNQLKKLVMTKWLHKTVKDALKNSLRQEVVETLDFPNDSAKATFSSTTVNGPTARINHLVSQHSVSKVKIYTVSSAGVSLDHNSADTLDETFDSVHEEVPDTRFLSYKGTFSIIASTSISGSNYISSVQRIGPTSRTISAVVASHASHPNSTISSPGHSSIRKQDNGEVFTRVTFRSGIEAGIFTEQGKVKDMDQCVDYCQNRTNCHVAFMVERSCYSIQCYSQKTCEILPVNTSEVTTEVVYMKGRLAQLPYELKNIAQRQENRTIDLQQCVRNMTVHLNVTLRDGIRAGNFTDLGKVESMETCFRSCCNRKSCDAAFMVLKNCFIIDCVSKEACAAIPSRLGRISTSLVYFNKTYDEAMVSAIGPKVKHPACPLAADIFSQVTFNGGIRAGNFTDHGEVETFDDCLKKCCDTSYCDAAFMVVKNCYSVKCAANRRRCLPVPSRITKYKTSIALLKRGGFEKWERRLNKITQCSRKPEILTGVTFRGGIKAGHFKDQGAVRNMGDCVNKCCRKPSCDIAFMVDGNCYSVKCDKNKSLCEPEYAKTTSHNTSMAFIRVKTNKLKLGSHVQSVLNRDCDVSSVQMNVNLTGGWQAGKFIRYPDVHTIHRCAQICCGYKGCASALMLGGRCYNLICFSEEQCHLRKSSGSFMVPKFVHVRASPLVVLPGNGLTVQSTNNFNSSLEQSAEPSLGILRDISLLISGNRKTSHSVDQETEQSSDKNVNDKDESAMQNQITALVPHLLPTTVAYGVPSKKSSAYGIKEVTGISMSVGSSKTEAVASKTTLGIHDEGNAKANAVIPKPSQTISSVLSFSSANVDTLKSSDVYDGSKKYKTISSGTAAVSFSGFFLQKTQSIKSAGTVQLKTSYSTSEVSTLLSKISPQLKSLDSQHFHEPALGIFKGLALVSQLEQGNPLNAHASLRAIPVSKDIVTSKQSSSQVVHAKETGPLPDIEEALEMMGDTDLTDLPTDTSKSRFTPQSTMLEPTEAKQTQSNVKNTKQETINLQADGKNTNQKPTEVIKLHTDAQKTKQELTEAIGLQASVQNTKQIVTELLPTKKFPINIDDELMQYLKDNSVVAALSSNLRSSRNLTQATTTVSKQRRINEATLTTIAAKLKSTPHSSTITPSSNSSETLLFSIKAAILSHSTPTQMVNTPLKPNTKNCYSSPVLKNLRFKFGMDAGKFEAAGNVNSPNECMTYCCMKSRCNAIFMLRNKCYLVSCVDEYHCQSVEVKSEFYKPAIGYISRDQADVQGFKRMVPSDRIQELSGSINMRADELPNADRAQTLGVSVASGEMKPVLSHDQESMETLHHFLDSLSPSTTTEEISSDSMKSLNSIVKASDGKSSLKSVRMSQSESQAMPRMDLDHTSSKVAVYSSLSSSKINSGPSTETSSMSPNHDLLSFFKQNLDVSRNKPPEYSTVLASLSTPKEVHQSASEPLKRVSPSPGGKPSDKVSSVISQSTISQSDIIITSRVSHSVHFSSSSTITPQIPSHESGGAKEKLLSEQNLGGKALHIASAPKADNKEVESLKNALHVLQWKQNQTSSSLDTAQRLIGSLRLYIDKINKHKGESIEKGLSSEHIEKIAHDIAMHFPVIPVIRDLNHTVHELVRNATKTANRFDKVKGILNDIETVFFSKDNRHEHPTIKLTEKTAHGSTKQPSSPTPPVINKPVEHLQPSHQENEKANEVEVTDHSILPTPSGREKRPLFPSHKDDDEANTEKETDHISSPTASANDKQSGINAEQLELSNKDTNQGRGVKTTKQPSSPTPLVSDKQSGNVNEVVELSHKDKGQSIGIDGAPESKAVQGRNRPTGLSKEDISDAITKIEQMKEQKKEDENKGIMSYLSNLIGKIKGLVSSSSTSLTYKPSHTDMNTHLPKEEKSPPVTQVPDSKPKEVIKTVTQLVTPSPALPVHAEKETAATPLLKLPAGDTTNTQGSSKETASIPTIPHAAINTGKVQEKNTAVESGQNIAVNFAEGLEPIHELNLEYNDDVSFCGHSSTEFNSTLRGGIKSGKFKDIGKVRNDVDCVNRCCEEQNCDVAFFLLDNCYLVSCYTDKLCESVPARNPHYSPRVVHVERKTSERMQGQNNFKLKLQDGLMKQSDETNKRPITHTLTIFPSKNPPSEATKSTPLAMLKESSPIEMVDNPSCKAFSVKYGVTMKGGLHSGFFKDQGSAPDFATCIRRCCKWEFCSLAFMVLENCYSVACYNDELCAVVPSKSPQLNPRIAYINNPKLQVLQGSTHSKNSSPVLKATTTADTKSTSEMVSKTPMSMPKFKCIPGSIEHDFTLSGGIEAGTFQDVGTMASMSDCASACCGKDTCNVAFMVMNHCYLVTCYNAKTCKTVPAKNAKYKTRLVHVARRPADDEVIGQFLANILQPLLSAKISRAQAKSVAVETGTQLGTSAEGNRKNDIPKFHDGEKGTGLKFVEITQKGISREEKNQKKSIGQLLSPLSHPPPVAIVSTITPPTLNTRPLPLIQPLRMSIKHNDSPALPRHELNLDITTQGLVSPQTSAQNGEGWKLAKEVKRKGSANVECGVVRVYHNATMRGGIHSGVIKDQGEAQDMKSCVSKCCQWQACSVAFMILSRCYAIACYNPTSCEALPANNVTLNPRLAVISRVKRQEINLFEALKPKESPTHDQAMTKHSKSPTVHQLDKASKEEFPSKPSTSLSTDLADTLELNTTPATVDTLSSITSQTKKKTPQRLDDINIDENKQERQKQTAESLSRTESDKSDSRDEKSRKFTTNATRKIKPAESSTNSNKNTEYCESGDPLVGVTLKHGLSAGTFQDKGNVSSAQKCGKLCCESKDCDVALVLINNCFLVKCKSQAYCMSKPARTRKYKPKLVYVNKLKKLSGMDLLDNALPEMDEDGASGIHEHVTWFPTPPGEKGTQPKLISSAGKPTIPSVPSHSVPSKSRNTKEHAKDLLTQEFETLPGTASTKSAQVHPSTTHNGLPVSTAAPTTNGRKEVSSSSSRHVLDETKTFQTTKAASVSTGDPKPPEQNKGIDEKGAKFRLTGLESTSPGQHHHPSPCQNSPISYNVTLRSGIRSGNFTDQGRVESVKACVSLCCEREDCNVAFMLKDNCYLVSCFSQRSCEPVPAHHSRFQPRLAYVRQKPGSELMSFIDEQDQALSTNAPSLTLSSTTATPAPTLKHSIKAYRSVSLSHKTGGNGDRILKENKGELLKSELTQKKHLHKVRLNKHSKRLSKSQLNVLFHLMKPHKNNHRGSHGHVGRFKNRPTQRHSVPRQIIAHPTEQPTVTPDVKQITLNKTYGDPSIDDSSIFFEDRFKGASFKSKGAKHSKQQLKKKGNSRHKSSKNQLLSDKQEAVEFLPDLKMHDTFYLKHNLDKPHEDQSETSGSHSYDSPTSDTSSVGSTLTSTCVPGVVQYNHTLKGEMNSGVFHEIEGVQSIEGCTSRCCAHKSCDLSFMVLGHCFLVTCSKSDPSLCDSIPALAIGFSPEIARVFRDTEEDESERADTGAASSPSTTPRPTYSPTTHKTTKAKPTPKTTTTKPTSPATVPQFVPPIPPTPIAEEPTKSSTSYQPAATDSLYISSQSTQKPNNHHLHRTCKADALEVNVTLRGGLHAGKFKSVGRTRDVHECARSCCGKPSCDLAYYVFQQCFLVKCYDDYLCATTHTKLPGFGPQVIRIKHIVRPKRPPKPQIDTIFNAIEPTGPTKSCAHSDIFKEFTLRKGYNAGVFTAHGKVESSQECLDICCQEKRCDMVFMFLDNCFTVTCNNSIACEIIPARKSAYKPRVAYLLRGHAKAPVVPIDPGLPGFLPTVSGPAPVKIVHFKETPLNYRQVTGQSKNRIQNRNKKNHNGHGKWHKYGREKHGKHEGKDDYASQRDKNRRGKQRKTKGRTRKKKKEQNQRTSAMDKVLDSLSKVMKENQVLENEVKALLHKDKKVEIPSTNATKNGTLVTDKQKQIIGNKNSRLDKIVKSEMNSPTSGQSPDQVVVEDLPHNGVQEHQLYHHNHREDLRTSPNYDYFLTPKKMSRRKLHGPRRRKGHRKYGSGDRNYQRFSVPDRPDEEGSERSKEEDDSYHNEDDTDDSTRMERVIYRPGYYGKHLKKGRSSRHRHHNSEGIGDDDTDNTSSYTAPTRSHRHGSRGRHRNEEDIGDDDADDTSSYTIPTRSHRHSSRGHHRKHRHDKHNPHSKRKGKKKKKSKGKIDALYDRVNELYSKMNSLYKLESEPKTTPRPKISTTILPKTTKGVTQNTATTPTTKVTTLKPSDVPTYHAKPTLDDLLRDAVLHRPPPKSKSKDSTDVLLNYIKGIYNHVKKIHNKRISDHKKQREKERFDDYSGSGSGYLKHRKKKSKKRYPKHFHEEKSLLQEMKSLFKDMKKMYQENSKKKNSETRSTIPTIPHPRKQIPQTTPRVMQKTTPIPTLSSLNHPGATDTTSMNSLISDVASKVAAEVANGIVNKVKANQGVHTVPDLGTSRDDQLPRSPDLEKTMVKGGRTQGMPYEGSSALNNKEITEAVKILEALQNPESYHQARPKDTRLDKAINLLERFNALGYNNINTEKGLPTTSSPFSKSNSDSAISKAVRILKNIQNPKMSSSLVMAKNPDLSHELESAQSSDLSREDHARVFDAGVAEAIDILKDLKEPHSELENEEVLPLRKGDNSLFSKARHHHRPNPELDETSSLTTNPELDYTEEESTPDLEKQRRPKHNKNPVLATKQNSNNPLESLVDSVAEEAAEKVEKEFGKSGAVRDDTRVTQENIPKIDEDRGGYASNPKLNEVDADDLGSDSEALPTSQRTYIPTEPMSPGMLGRQELDAMLRYRMKLKKKMESKKRTKPGLRKKVDIPHDVGNDVYLIVHLGFEGAVGRKIKDDSGLHNDVTMTSQTAITANDSKCGSAMRMRGGQLLFNSKSFHGTPREGITIATWIKLETMYSLFNLFSTQGDGARYTLQVVNGKVHWSHLDDRGRAVFSLETDPVVNAGDWTHVGATYDSRTNMSKVIVNGQVVGEKKGHGKLSQNWSGRAGIGLSGGIKGVVDEFYMYNRAIAASDIGDLSEQCNLGPGQAIPTKEGGYNGLIPEHMIEEALAKMKSLQHNTTTTSTTRPPTTTTTTPTTTPTTPPKSTTKALTMAPVSVSVDQPKCEQSLFYYNTQLSAGMKAGLFIDLGHASVTTECIKRCCQIESCDLVFLSRNRCFAVDCFSDELCEPVARSAVDTDVSSIYYISRNGKSIVSKVGHQSLQSTTLPPVPFALPTIRPLYYNTVDDDANWDSPLSPTDPAPGHARCTQSVSYYNVGLKGGWREGDLLDNTYTATMDRCVALCCESRRCDLAMMKDGECFTMSCPVEKCTVEDGGEFQITFVNRKGGEFDEPTMFPTFYSTPTLGVSESASETPPSHPDEHKKYLSLYLGFDHLSGKTVIDGSGLNNNAEMTTGTSITLGRKGPGADFEGGDIVLHGKHFRRKPRDAVSMAVWVKMAVTQGTHSIFDTIGGSRSIHKKGQYHFEVSNGRVRWFHRDEYSRPIFAVQSDPFIDADEWYHVAATYDSRDRFAKIYINGELKGVTRGKGKLSQDWGERAGFGSHGGRRIFFGAMDEIYMFSRALAGDEILRYINNLQKVSGAKAFTTKPTTIPTSIVLDSFSSMSTEPPTTSVAPTRLHLKQALDSFKGVGNNKGNKTSTTEPPVTTPTTAPTTTPPTTKQTTTQLPATTKAPTDTKPTTPQSVCLPGDVYHNRDLVGGLGAGNFTDKGRVKSTDECMSLCCVEEGCTVAYIVGMNCFTVACKDERRCKTYVNGPLEVSPVIGFVRRYRNGVEISPTLSPNPISKPTHDTMPKGTPSPTLPGEDYDVLPSKNPSCSHSKTYYHVTIKDGLKAGEFSKLAESSNMAECVVKCCARISCHVAIMMKDTCFGVRCKSREACEARPAHLKSFHLALVYINRKKQTTPTTHPSHSTTEPSLDELLGRVQPAISAPTKPSLELSPITYNNPSINPPTPATSNKTDQSCSQGLRINNVILNGGMGAGEVTQYPDIPDVEKCAGKCCQSRDCHVALVIRDACYTVKCYSKDLCRTRPLQAGSNVTSKVVYVSKKGIQLFSSANEAEVSSEKPPVTSPHGSGNNTIGGTPVGPTPTKGQMKCFKGKTFYNVRLRGDLSAGEFTDRGLVSNMDACAQICCEERSCDLAYLLQGKCYSVTCQSRDLCQVITASSLALNPAVAYVHRYIGGGMLQGIMGGEVTLPTTPPHTTTTQTTTLRTTPKHHNDHHTTTLKHPKQHHPKKQHPAKQHATKKHPKKDKAKLVKEELENIVTHLSAADLATIVSLDGTETAAQLEAMTRCKASQFGCQQYCINLVDGGHRCMCHEGYKLSSNGRDCEDINACRGIHECEHSCVEDAFGNSTCECRSGFMINADGKHCDDMDECLLEVHGCAQTCTNTRGSYKCACSEGYTLDTDKMNCRSMTENAWRKDTTHPDRGLEIPTFIIQTPKDVTIRQGGTAVFNCKARGHPAPHIAWAIGANGDAPLPTDDRYDLLPSGALVVKGVNLTDEGMYRCVASNPAGAATRSAVLKVQDLNECEIRKHTCDQVCVNTIGSFRCGCNVGYTLRNDSKTCSDIDECLDDAHLCDQRCTNTPGSYACDCYHGYSLSSDMKTCIDIDECTMTSHGCSQLCNNTLGGYNCYCLSGYSLGNDNRTCTELRSYSGAQSITVSAGMAAFGALGIVAMAVLIAGIAYGVRFYKKRAEQKAEDAEAAKKSLFSWLE